MLKAASWYFNNRSEPRAIHPAARSERFVRIYSFIRFSYRHTSEIKKLLERSRDVGKQNNMTNKCKASISCYFFQVVSCGI